MNIERSYDKEKLIDQILNIYDPEVKNSDHYNALSNLIDHNVKSLNVKKSKIEQIIADLQDEYLVISYQIQTHIIDEGHTPDGTLWLDLNIEIEDAAKFAKWIKLNAPHPESLNHQNDIEQFIEDYVTTHTVKFDDLGLGIHNSDVN